MKSNLSALAAVAALAGAPVFAQAVSGRVVEDSSGSPLASVELKFHKSGLHELAADLETDRDGRFRAEGLAAGEYSVEVSKPNFVTATLKLRVPLAGLELRLVRYAVIAGQARDADGKPLEGRVFSPTGRTTGSARIAILVKRPGSEELEAVRTVALAEGGRYRIFDLPPGRYAVGLWWAGLSAGSGAQLYPDNANPRFFTVSGGEDYRDVDFTLMPGASFSVSGKIEMPKENTPFSLALGLPEQPTLPIAQMVTERDGTFRFDKIPSGTYDLFVAGPDVGYGAFGSVLGTGPLYGRARIQVLGQNVEGISVPVSAGRSLEVVLQAHGDQAPPPDCPKSATVALALLEPWGILGNSPAQAAFGKPQKLADLAPARYRVTAGGLGGGCYQVNQPVVDLSGAPSGPVAIELAAGGSIRGTLQAGQAKATDFAVVLLDADASDSGTARLALPDEHGHFVFDTLRPGRYRIAAQPAAGASRARWVDLARMIEIEVPGGVPTDLELPATTAPGGGK